MTMPFHSPGKSSKLPHGIVVAKPVTAVKEDLEGYWLQ